MNPQKKLFMYLIALAMSCCITAAQEEKQSAPSSSEQQQFIYFMPVTLTAAQKQEQQEAERWGELQTRLFMRTDAVVFTLEYFLLHRQSELNILFQTPEARESVGLPFFLRIVEIKPRDFDFNNYIRMIKKHGFDVNKPINNKLPIEHAIDNHNFELAKALLMHGAQPHTHLLSTLINRHLFDAIYMRQTTAHSVIEFIYSALDLNKSLYQTFAETITDVVRHDPDVGTGSNIDCAIEQIKQAIENYPAYVQQQQQKAAVGLPVLQNVLPRELVSLAMGYMLINQKQK